MIFPALFFYLFAGVCIAAAVMVIAARNPVHSVLFLILAFVNAAALFVLLGAEFLAMILIIVYVGAVLVLFLFVVMMLDVDFAQLRQGFMQYLPIGAFLGDHEGGIEADPKLPDKAHILARVARKLVHEGRRAGSGDRAEVVDQFFPVHPDAVVGDRQGAGGFIWGKNNAVFAVALG